uniref:BACK domain-containing protein n=1 Tax=Brugia pahangi TaxID=6280 RepID=A0A0N4T468_BRUPA
MNLRWEYLSDAMLYFRRNDEVSSISGRFNFKMRQLNHLKSSLKCRLSIIKREVLRNGSGRIDDGLIDRCVEVGVGKLELQVFQHQQKKIREVVSETKCADLDEWKEKAYATFAAIPPVEVDVKYFRSLHCIIAFTYSDFHMLKEKDICLFINCLVIYSEFLDFEFDLKNLLQLFDDEAMIIIQNPSVLSISINIFARIHKWRCKSKKSRFALLAIWINNLGFDCGALFLLDGVTKM